MNLYIITESQIVDKVREVTIYTKSLLKWITGKAAADAYSKWSLLKVVQYTLGVI